MSAAKGSFQKGEYEKTEQLLNAALIETRKFKSTDPRIIITFGNLALLYQNQKKFSQAETFYERVLALRKQTLPENDPRIAADLNNLATVLSAQGKNKVAKEQLQEALAINEQAYGKDHPSVATNLNNLASIYHLEGNSAQAEEFYLRALAIQQKALGANHGEVALTRHNLTELYRSQGEVAKAKLLQKQSAGEGKRNAPSTIEPRLSEAAEPPPSLKVPEEKVPLLEKPPVAAPQAEAPIRREKMGAQTIQDLFQGQMDYIFFFQGLAFFLVLAVCCLFRGDAYQRLPWRWMGFFALAQGMAAWLSLVAINFADPAPLKTIGASLHLISWIFLMEFGRSGMNRNQGRDSGLWLVALLLMVTALGGLKGWSGIEFISRYTLGLTGGLWAAAAILATGRDLSPQDRGSSRIAGICVGLFGVTTALSPPHSPLFPASFLNQDLLLRLTGVPMEFFQGLLAFGMAAGIYGYLPWREKEEATQDTRYRTRYMFALLATLSVILGLGSVLTLYMGDWAHKRHEKVKAEAFEYATIVVNRLNSEFKRLDDAGKALAETSWLSLSMRGNREEDLARINSLLDRYRETLDASVCYLMDTTGKTIASSNRAAPDSFVGHNYGFRPYFKQAISGGIGRYFAVGVTSKVPGYYVGGPVRVPRGTTTRGVAVIKVSMDKITKELQNAVQKGDSMMCLADPRGIVFLATNQDMIFKSLWPVEGDKAELKEQYGKEQFPAIFPAKFGDGARVDLGGHSYLVSYTGTIHAGWSVYFFRPIERVGVYRLTGILMACILAILALVSLGSNFYLKEHALSTAGKFRAILEAAPEAVAVIDPDTSKIIESNRFMAKSLGYTQKELLSLKLNVLLNQEPQETQDQLQKIIQADEAVVQNWQVRHKNGSYLNLEVIGSKLRHGGKDQVLVLGREVEAGLRSPTGEFRLGYQTNASEALLSGKMDEFNNILSSLILQTEMTLDEQPKESNVSRNLEEMLQAAVRAKDLIREMAIRPSKELPDQKTAKVQKKHILLVDDEAQLCRLEEKLLQRLGYQVTAFTDSPSALKAFRKNPDDFDLVVTDSSMSKLSGLELAEELLRLRPNLPIILATGFSEAEKISRAQQIGVKECLEKPILAGDLDKVLRRLLDGHHLC
ncbi:MAG: tetratricopeptide repeat protein [Thermodesulfobacteriota bacterium]